MQQNKERIESNLRGFDNLADALMAEHFPLKKEEVYYAVGDMLIEDSNGKYVPVRDVLDNINQNEFQTADEIVAGLQKSLGRVH